MMYELDDSRIVDISDVATILGIDVEISPKFLRDNPHIQNNLMALGYGGIRYGQDVMLFYVPGKSQEVPEIGRERPILRSFSGRYPDYREMTESAKMPMI